VFQFVCMRGLALQLCVCDGLCVCVCGVGACVCVLSIVLVCLLGFEGMCGTTEALCE